MRSLVWKNVSVYVNIWLQLYCKTGCKNYLKVVQNFKICSSLQLDVHKTSKMNQTPADWHLKQKIQIQEEIMLT